jgi:LCP family protein required for cell wall assembly
VLTVLVLLTACTVGYFNWRLGQIQRIDLGLADAASGGPENYLIVGSDSRSGITSKSRDAGAFLNDPQYQSDPNGSGQRSDTIMIMRIDPSSKSAQLLSFPRDLYVPIAGEDHSDKINAAFAIGVPTLVDTIQQNFRIPINHYVEVDFVGFQKLIDAMGGVELYFDKPMWDDHTGLNVATVGCHNLDGAQALAFARSRYLWYNTSGKDAVDTSNLAYYVSHERWDDMDYLGWHRDGTSDLGRISRQQLLIRTAIPQAEHAAFRNPTTLNAIMASVVDSIKVDSGLSSGRLIELANRFRHFDPDELKTYSFPGVPEHSPTAGDILKPDEQAAERMLSWFRGETPGGPEEGIPVRVLNASGIDQQAANVAGALARVGFQIDSTADASTEGIDDLEVTQVRYAAGNEYNARVVAKHLSAPVELVPLEGSTSDVIEVVTGSNFTTVSTTRRDLAKSELPPTTTAPEQTGSSDDGASTSSTTSTTVVGVVPEQDKSC